MSAPVLKVYVWRKRLIASLLARAVGKFAAKPSLTCCVGALMTLGVPAFIRSLTTNYILEAAN